MHISMEFFLLGGNMSKAIAYIISLILTGIMLLTEGLNSYAASLYLLEVNYIYYNTSGGYTVYREESFEDVSTANIGLFQIAVDDEAQRSDGYIFECNSKWHLDGVTEYKSVSISFGNPMTYNSGVSSAVLSNPYNRIDVDLYLADGSKVSFEGIGGNNDLGNVGVFELYNYGTCEMSEEIVVTLIQGVAISRVDIRVSLFADQKSSPYRPMSWWGNASLTFGDYTNTDKVIADIGKKVDQIVMPSVEDQEKANQFESEVADKKEQSDKLIEDSKVEKPSISDDDLNPMDRVDGEALNTMGGVIGAIFSSPTLGSIAMMTLVFALIGYILYGKR